MRNLVTWNLYRQLIKLRTYCFIIGYIHSLCIFCYFFPIEFSYKIIEYFQCVDIFTRICNFPLLLQMFVSFNIRWFKMVFVPIKQAFSNTLFLPLSLPPPLNSTNVLILFYGSQRLCYCRITLYLSYFSPVCMLMCTFF